MEKSRSQAPEKSRSFAGRSLCVDESDNADDPGSAKSMGELEGRERVGLTSWVYESENADDPGSAKFMGELEGRERVDLTSLGIEVGKFNLNQACQEIDAFINGMCKDNTSTLDLPESLDVFLGLVEGLIDKYDCPQGEHSAKLGNLNEEDVEFFNALHSLSKLTNALEKYQSHSTEMTASLNRANCAQKRAMTFLERKLGALLQKPKRHHDTEKTKKIKSIKSSFKHQSHEPFRCILPEATGSVLGEDVEFPGYSEGVVTSMSRIANSMISSGYKTECSQVYGSVRRSQFMEAQKTLKFEVISDDDLQKMQWESLEGEVSTWSGVVEKVTTVHLPGERKLFDAVFTNYPDMWNELFSPLVESVGIRLLTFADSVAKTKRSPEKLFKFIDIYESIRDNFPKICSQFEPMEPAEKLKNESTELLGRIGEVIINIFLELENSIKSDVSKQTVPSGAVHPLTRYTINYLGYACEYWNTLDQVLTRHQNHHQDQENESSSSADYCNAESEQNKDHNGYTLASSSRFLKQIATVMELLDANLNAKANLYRDPSLRYIFLMNNGRYILQKMKGISQVYRMMGEVWGRKRSSELRQYHKSYQRETWGKVLVCLSHEGIQVNGKVNKPAVKERFKTFNAMFDSIHKTQSTWVVSDTQLQSELRISVSSVVVPAYRSFLGRFGQYLDSGRQTEKYVKYQPDDIQNLIDELFDGNPKSMGRRR